MLSSLFAWSVLSIAMCWRDEKTRRLVNLHISHVYPLSPLRQLAHRDGPYSLYLLCHSLFCQTWKTGIFWQREPRVLRLLCFDQMSATDSWSTGFLLHIMQRAHVHIVHVELNLLMGAVWPPARCTNDNFLRSGCNGLAPASAAPSLFVHDTGSAWVCVLCGNDDNIPRTARGRTVSIRLAY